MSQKIKILSLMLTVSMALSTAACDLIIEKRVDPYESDSTIVTFETETETETESETEVPVFVAPEYVNPLTGLGVSEDIADNRPIAVMINNIKAAMPQHGTSAADVIYECIVEGAQTRLMAVYLDYENLPSIGSVRSSREYYLDFAGNHDAIYVHAGGSDEAYRQLKLSRTNNLDGVNMYLPDTFYRDKERLKTHPYEHTLMTNGEKIVSGIEYKGYRSEADTDFVQPFKFVDFEEEIIPRGDSADYVGVSYSAAHSPYYTYDSESLKYTRYQFDAKQKDANTGDALTFDNIVILYLNTYYTGDDKGHYSVKATGTGDGIYVTRGKSEKITWKKDSRNSAVKLYDLDGNELVMNRGKTMMQICTTAMAETTVISGNQSQSQQNAQEDGTTAY